MDKEILIIDDQPGIRMLLTDILAEEGYHITTAANGKEAINKLHKHTYDLMLIDYKLPIISGMEILHLLEREKNTIPVIVISGLLEEIEKELADIHLVKEVLAKPFDVHELVRTVKSIIG